MAKMMHTKNDTDTGNPVNLISTGDYESGIAAARDCFVSTGRIPEKSPLSVSRAVGK